MPAWRVGLIAGSVALVMVIGVLLWHPWSRPGSGGTGTEVTAAEEQFKRGKASEEQKNFAEAAQWFEKAAKQGHAEALDRLGLMNAEGRGVTKDEKAAVTWFSADRKSVV